MKRYVVGLYFSPQLDRVVLIRKNRPDWQKGLLNGIGGAIEPGEPPLAAMVREFNEETGLIVTRWELLLTIADLSRDSFIHFFRASGPLEEVRTITDERVEIAYTNEITATSIETIPNLNWIIPLCLQRVTYSPFTVTETHENL